MSRLIKLGFTPFVTPDMARNDILTGAGFTPRGPETQIYSIESSGCLYKVDPSDGTWTQVGGAGVWKGTIAGGVLDGTLYTVEASGALYATDPITGRWKQLGGVDYADTRLLLAAAGRLFTIENSGSLYAITAQ